MTRVAVRSLAFMVLKRSADWAIDPLKRDLSYRDFAVEQLAGDMLDGASVEQRIATVAPAGRPRRTSLYSGP